MSDRETLAEISKLAIWQNGRERADWIMDNNGRGPHPGDEFHAVADAILASDWLAAERARIWDEVLNEIDEHEINTQQARDGNPYRAETEEPRR